MGEVPEGSVLLRAAFATLAVCVGAAAVWNVNRASRGLHDTAARTRTRTAGAAAIVAAWMALTYFVASTGVIADFSRQPPPMVLMLVAVLSVSVAMASSRLGRELAEGLPLWLLVANQSFRFPLELLMHRAAEEGVMPPQMSYSGWNFDIVTGVTAIPVAWALARHYPRARVLAVTWNMLGMVLLANILVVAMISTPLVAAFGERRLNIWVAHPPYVWLPTVMVLCAITGHLLILRKLQATATRRL